MTFVMIITFGINLPSVFHVHVHVHVHVHTCISMSMYVGDAGAEYLFIRKSTNSGTAQVHIELIWRAETSVYQKFFE